MSTSETVLDCLFYSCRCQSSKSTDVFFHNLPVLTVGQTEGAGQRNDGLCKKYFNFLLRLLIYFALCGLEQTQ